MKVFNKENDILKVYVQLGDLLFLYNIGYELPDSVIKKLRSIKLKDNVGLNSFLEFNSPNEVKFFKDIDFIIDFKEYSKKGLLEIANKITNLKTRPKDYILDYRIETLENLLNFRQGNISIPLPSVPDNDSFFVNDSSYMVKTGLNPFQLIVSRTDGKEIDQDKIEVELIDKCEDYLVIQHIGDIKPNSDISKMVEVSPSKKSLIVTYFFNSRSIIPFSKKLINFFGRRNKKGLVKDMI